MSYRLLSELDKALPVVLHNRNTRRFKRCKRCGKRTRWV